jgi:hypothetical protein
MVGLADATVFLTAGGQPAMYSAVTVKAEAWVRRWMERGICSQASEMCTAAPEKKWSGMSKGRCSNEWTWNAARSLPA